MVFDNNCFETVPKTLHMMDYQTAILSCSNLFMLLKVLS